MRPRKSAIGHLHITFVVGRAGVSGRLDRRFLDLGRRAHADDLRAWKTRHDRLHQRIVANAVFQFGLSRLLLGINARHARLAGNDHHPTFAGPVGKLFREFADEAFWRILFKRDFDPAVLETHQPNVALQRAFNPQVALFSGEGHQRGKAR